MNSQIRLSWCPKTLSSLRRAVLMASDGEFMKLLQLPENEKKGKTRDLCYGWEEVRQIMAEEHPEFEATRQQLADKWRKSLAAEKVKSRKLKSERERERASSSSPPSHNYLSTLDSEQSQAAWIGDDLGSHEGDAGSDAVGGHAKLNRSKEERALLIAEHKKRLESMDAESLGMKKFQEKKLALMEAEHDRRLELMQEESDLKKSLMKEEHDLKMHFLEEQFKGNKSGENLHQV